MAKKAIRFLKNKYLLTFLAFLLWIVIFDQHNLIDRFRYIRERRQLEHDKAYYRQRIKEDAKRLEELQTNDENLEKFAREQYLMKKENEDIFIIEGIEE
jgi:cell division protein FtsB